MDYSQLPGFEADTQQQQPAAPTDYSQMPGFLPTAQSHADDDSVLPNYANGLSHEAPINVSPLDVTQRLQLAAGQVGGSMTGTVKTLQGWGYEVRKDKEGELVIKDPKDSLWKRYDAKDAWDSSRSIWQNIKEGVKDIADIVPGVAAGAVQQAVAAPAMAGAAAITAMSGGALTVPAIALAAFGQGAGAIAATAGMTVMGKLAGTYQPNPDEDFSDLMTETLLNLGGGIIGAGMKPTAAVIGRQFEKLGPNLVKLDEATKKVAATIFGTTNGIGADKARYVIDDAATVGANLKRFSGKSSDVIKNELHLENVGELDKVLKQVWPTINQIGQKEADAVVAAVKQPGFKMSGQEVTHSGFKALESAADGRGVVRYAVDHPKLPGVATYVNSLEEALASGRSFSAVPKTAQELADMGYTEAAQAELGTLIKNISGFGKPQEIYGKDAVKWAMQTRKDMLGAVKQLKSEAMGKSITQLNPIYDTFSDGLDAALKGKLDLATGGVRSATGEITGGAFSNFLQKYATMKRDLSPYTAVIKKAGRALEETQPVLTLLNQMDSAAGSNAFRKGAGDRLVNYMQQYGIQGADDVAKRLGKIELNNVTSAVAPITRPGLIGQTSATVGLSGLITASPAMLTGAVGGALTSSPRAFLKATPAMLKTARTVKALTAAGGTKLMKAAQTDPRILQQLLVLPLRMGEEEANIQQQVGGMLQQAVQQPVISPPNLQDPTKQQGQRR